MQNDDLVRTLVNRNGRLVEPERELPPPQPSHVQVPRRAGSDLAERLSENVQNQGAVERLMNGVGIMGVALPMGLAELLLDRFKPQMKGVDVNLPNTTGRIDPRILEKTLKH